jgi:hypothetical protein
MKYQVTFHTNSNIQVGVPRSQKRIVDVSRNNVESMSDLDDIDSQNRNNNYVLIWDAVLGKHVYVHPSEILDRADDTDDDALDYGTY